MCEYCDENNTRETTNGDDNIIFDSKDSKHYLFIHHFYNEKYNIEVNYCPKCGRNLS